MKLKKLLLVTFALTPMFASAQRLVGLTNAIYNTAISDFLNTDSTVYSYTGTHAYYDQALNSTYSYALSGYFWNTRTLKTYDGSGNVTKINVQNCDTPSTWVDVSETDYTYDGSGNTTSISVQMYNKSTSTWYPYSRDGYTYDASNNMLTDTSYYNGGKGYGPQTLLSNTLDGSGHLVSSTYKTYFGGSWYNYVQDAYTVNGAGKILTDISQRYNSKKSVWTNSTQETYTYDGSNNILSYLYQTWDTAGGGSWQNNTMSTLTYSGSNVITLDTATYSGGAWAPQTHDSMSYDASNNMIAEIFQYYSSSISKYVNSTLISNTYNASNKITTSTLSRWNFPGWGYNTSKGLGTQARYYYETTDVPNVANAGGSIKLYPVPANNFLDINITWNKSQTAVIAIYDLNGKLYSQWQTANGGNYNTNIATNHLPAGSYILKVKGANGVITERFSVVH